MDLWCGIWTAFRPREGGIWTKNFQKFKSPGGCPGGMFKLRFDWYIIARGQTVFLTLTQTYTLTKPPWCSLFTWSLSSRYVIRVLSKSFHRPPIQHKRRHKFNICSKGQGNLGVRRYAPPVFLKLYVANSRIQSHAFWRANFYGKSVVYDRKNRCSK